MSTLTVKLRVLGPHRDFRVSGALFMPELGQCQLQYIPRCVDIDKP